MRVAVVTPHFQTPPASLDRCIESVRSQTVPCTHFVVCDGDTLQSSCSNSAVNVITLPRPHCDTGNAARAVGAVSAICQGFEAIAFLDADNWFDDNHVETLIRVHRQTQAAFCSSARKLVSVDGVPMGICYEVDGNTFVDTNCMFFTAAAYPLIAEWYLMPFEYHRRGIGDRWVWAKVKQSGVMRAHHHVPTVNYVTRYAVHYRHFGLPVPEGAKSQV